MKVNKKQGRFLSDTINKWESDGTIAKEIADVLRNSYSVRPFDWKKLAKYSFWISIICVIISFSSIFDLLFDASETFLLLFFAVLSAGFYFFAYKRRQKYPHKVFSNEFLIFLGVAGTAVFVGLLGEIIGSGNRHLSLLFLLSTAIYAVIGLVFPSKLVWIFSVLSFGFWFGTETGYISGWGAYYLGMNYPMRFVFFGAVLTGLSFFLKKTPKTRQFYKPTYIMGLLYLFIALWIMSIFGNYESIYHWQRADQYELLHWGIVFGIVALTAVWYGLKYDDYASRSFGITFLFINLYTKFFEFFWDALHKGIFFLVLAVSFWWIGKRAEKIWNLEFIGKDQKGESK